nr:MAG TPA: hypothetical protein [Caudoviricetes sp.]
MLGGCGVVVYSCTGGLSLYRYRYCSWFDSGGHV